MKCPKCGYLGFESVTRCRNCGYDFSLAYIPPVPELPIRAETAAIGALDDLSLIDAAVQRSAPLSDAEPDLEGALTAASRAHRPLARSEGPGISGLPGIPAIRDELPLFGSPEPDDEPLIRRSSRPRPPLAVRRATAEVPRVRSRDFLDDGPGDSGGAQHAGGSGGYGAPRPQTLDLGPDLDDLDARAGRGAPASVHTERSADVGRPASLPDDVESAGIGERLVAVAIDALILAAIDAIVVYFTLQICGVPLEEVGILPKGPLLAFLLVQNGGYLVAFTAGGQTLGKMAAGIRVVPAETEGSLDIGRAFIRALTWIVLAAPAGLGFLTLLRRDHRGLHDRFAGTRVVRAVP